MLSYCTNYLAAMPDITVYMNCDTRLAINLSMFNLGKDDEFIFVIKNYNYIDSHYVFMQRARLGDEDENGEIIFKIDPDVSKAIKPGAFYNFSVLLNAFNEYEPTEYKKLTENGKVNIEYGAQELLIGPEVDLPVPYQDIISAELKPIGANDFDTRSLRPAAGTILEVHLEEATDV